MKLTPGHIVRSALWRTGKAFMSLAERIDVGDSNSPSEIEVIEQDGDWAVCRIRGIVWRLNVTQFIDSMLLKDGVFESRSLEMVATEVKPGMIVADVGANFGYYSVQLSRWVGERGQVHALEPSARYRERLIDHLRRNECHNVVVAPFGLSDERSQRTLFGDEISAALDWADYTKPPTIEETVSLRTLDDYVDEQGLPHLDFIKVDIDGHEPRFIAGATRTLRRFQPVLLMEFAQLNLMAAGSDVEQLARQLTDLGYSFYSVETGKPYLTHADFLRDSMNCSHSVNVFCRPDAKRVTV